MDCGSRRRGGPSRSIVRDSGAAMVRIALLSLIALQLQEHVQYILLKTRAAPRPDWLEDAREVDDVAVVDEHEPG